VKDLLPVGICVFVFARSFTVMGVFPVYAFCAAMIAMVCGLICIQELIQKRKNRSAEVPTPVPSPANAKEQD
jgi:hypothetical protein